MSYVIYLDVLFYINLVINFAILRLVKSLLKLPDKTLRSWLAAALGAFYSLLVFFPSLSFLFHTGAKIGFCFVIVLIAFKISSARRLFKITLCYFAVSFAAAGGITLIYTFLPAGSGKILARNGVFYADIKPLTLLLITAICLLLINISYRLFSHGRDGKKEYYSVLIEADKRQVRLKALVDTGNRLCDPITGSYAIVAEYEKIKAILPGESKAAFALPPLQACNELSGSPWEARFRVLPYRSVNDDGLLTGFKPDKITVYRKENEVVLSNAVVGISLAPLSENNEFDALLNPGMLTDI